MTKVQEGLANTSFNRFLKEDLGFEKKTKLNWQLD
jgi:hypothetical protein